MFISGIGFNAFQCKMKIHATAYLVMFLLGYGTARIHTASSIV